MNSIIKNKQFVAINGIDHFVTTYSTNEDNEVVIYVHGGPLQQVEAFSSLLSAPSKSIISLEHHGHTPHFIEPDMFSSVFDNAFRK